MAKMLPTGYIAEMLTHEINRGVRNRSENVDVFGINSERVTLDDEQCLVKEWPVSIEQALRENKHKIIQDAENKTVKVTIRDSWSSGNWRQHLSLDATLNVVEEYGDHILKENGLELTVECEINGIQS